jgi:hypothetical protein
MYDDDHDTRRLRLWLWSNNDLLLYLVHTHRRQIRLIESNAKCHYLKKLTRKVGLGISDKKNNFAGKISKIVSEKTIFDVQAHQFVKLFCSCFVKLIISAEFHSVPFRSELRNWLFPRNSECLGISVFFRGITETVSSLFRGIFSEQNYIPNPTVKGTLRQVFICLRPPPRFCVWVGKAIL